MKTRRTLFFSFTLLLAATFGMRAQDVSEGKKLVETNQWNKANQFFIDKVKSNPLDPSLKFFLAESYYALGKVDSAESNYSRSQDYAMSVAGLGKIILSKGDTVKAKEVFNKAIKAEKKNGDLYGYIADACIAANYPKLAEQYIARGKDVTTKNARIYMAIGNLEKLKGNFGPAANAYENANFYDKNFVLPLVKVGNIYLDSRSWDSSEKAFKQALQIDPKYPLAFKGLGDMYFKSGRFAEASSNYKSYFVNSEITLDDKYRYVFILFYNQEYAEATKMIENLLAVDAKNPVLLRIQAYMSYELGMENKKVKNPDNIKTALTNITNFFNAQTKDRLLSSDYEYLAKIQIASGLDSLAPDNYKKAYAMDSSKTSFIEEGAKIYRRLNKFMKAIPYYQTLLRISPDNVGINTFNIGQMYYLQALKNDTAKADTAIRKQNLILADTSFHMVTRLIPTSHLGLLWSARTETYLDAKQEGLANASYEKLIQFILALPPDQAAKRKNDLFDAYNYFASLYYGKAYVALVKKNMPELQELKGKAMEYWNKMKELNPNDPKPDEGIKATNDLKPAPPRKQPQATE